VGGVKAVPQTKDRKRQRSINRYVYISESVGDTTWLRLSFGRKQLILNQRRQCRRASHRDRCEFLSREGPERHMQFSFARRWIGSNPKYSRKAAKSFCVFTVDVEQDNARRLEPGSI
jgi:hypothetical protein